MQAITACIVWHVLSQLSLDPIIFLVRIESTYMAMKIMRPRTKGITKMLMPMFDIPACRNRRMSEPITAAGKKLPRPPRRLVPPRQAAASARNS